MPADSRFKLAEQLIACRPLPTDNGGCMTMFCEAFERTGFNCAGIEIAVMPQPSAVYRRIPDLLLREHV